MTTRDITRRAGRSCRDSTGRAAAPRGPWFGSAARQLLPDTRGVNTTARHKNISVRAKILHNHIILIVSENKVSCDLGLSMLLQSQAKLFHICLFPYLISMLLSVTSQHLPIFQPK